MENFKNQYGLRYQILLDSQRKVWGQYGMGYIPHNVVISPDWVVRYTNYGYDKNALIGTIEQWLPQTAVAGEDRSETSPASFALGPVYPNPFSLRSSEGAVRIGLKSPAGRAVELAVYDVQGRRVRALGRVVQGGSQTLLWDGRDDAGRILPAGIYWFRARLGSKTVIRRVVLLR